MKTELAFMDLKSDKYDMAILRDLLTIHSDLSLCNKDASQALLESCINKLDRMGLFEQGYTWFLVGEFARIFDDTLMVQSEVLKSNLYQTVSQWDLIKNDIDELDVLGGAIFGGLKSIDYHLQDSAIGSVTKELKWMAYESFTKEGGALCFKASTKELAYEMTFACVPFGLFEPEDLVLVESVEILGAQIESAQTAFEKLLFAHYLLERGDRLGFATAYDQARRMTLTSVEKALVKLIDVKVKGKKLGSIGEITHRPDGNGNVYAPQPDERHPKIITEGDEVDIHATVMSGEYIETLTHYSVNGQAFETIVMEKEGLSYVASIKGLKSLDEVTYYIQNQYHETKHYHFTVNQCVSMDYISDLQVIDGNISLFGCQKKWSSYTRDCHYPQS